MTNSSNGEAGSSQPNGSQKRRRSNSDASGAAGETGESTKEERKAARAAKRQRKAEIRARKAAKQAAKGGQPSQAEGQSAPKVSDSGKTSASGEIGSAGMPSNPTAPTSTPAKSSKSKSGESKTSAPHIPAEVPKATAAETPSSKQPSSVALPSAPSAAIPSTSTPSLPQVLVQSAKESSKGKEAALEIDAPSNYTAPTTPAPTTPILKKKAMKTKGASTATPSGIPANTTATAAIPLAGSSKSSSASVRKAPSSPKPKKKSDAFSESSKSKDDEYSGLSTEELALKLNLPGQMNAFLSSKFIQITDLKKLEDAGVLTYKRGPWSDEEKTSIRRFLETFKTIHRMTDSDLVDTLLAPKIKGRRTKHPKFWCDVAAEVPGRPVQYVYRHVRQMYDPTAKKGIWSPEEDAELVRWVKIAKIVDRSAEDCRDHYRNDLKDRATRHLGLWNQEELDRLVTAIKETNIALGTDELARESSWDVVAQKMGGSRTRAQCRKKWQSNLRDTLLGKRSAALSRIGSGPAGAMSHIQKGRVNQSSKIIFPSSDIIENDSDSEGDY